MKTYYVAGLPYSDDLWHYGTKGMKWGQRLYQNPDGTLTPLGKIHYSVKNTAKTIGNAAAKATKTVIRHEVDKFKRKHPWTMSDQEIKEKTDRIKLEVAYKEAVRNRSKLNRGKELVRDVLENGMKTLGSKMFNSIGDKIFGKKEPKLRDLEDLLNDPDANARDFEVAKKAWDAKQDIQKIKDSEYKYNISDISDTKSMSKKELDNLNAWLSSERRTTEALRKTDEYISGREALDEWLEKASTRGDSRRVLNSEDN